MPAQNRANRINRMVIELQQLGERIKRCSDNPIRCAGIFRRVELEDQREKRKKLCPGIEPQIVGPAPQQETENAYCQQRPQQQSSRPRIHALLNNGGKDCGEQSVIGSRSQNNVTSFGFKW